MEDGGKVFIETWNLRWKICNSVQDLYRNLRAKIRNCVVL